MMPLDWDEMSRTQQWLAQHGEPRPLGATIRRHLHVSRLLAWDEMTDAQRLMATQPIVD
jgi:hypothetical protein